MDKQEIVERYSGHWHSYYGRYVKNLRQNGKEAIGDCPLCDDHKAHLYASVETGFFDCKKCGKSGDAFTFHAQLHNLDGKENLMISVKNYKHKETHCNS